MWMVYLPFTDFELRKSMENIDGDMKILRELNPSDINTYQTLNQCDRNRDGYS